MNDIELSKLRQGRASLGSGRSSVARTSDAGCACIGKQARSTRAALYAGRRVHGTTVECGKCGTRTAELWAGGKLIRSKTVAVDPVELERKRWAERRQAAASFRSNRYGHPAGCRCSTSCEQVAADLLKPGPIR